MITLAFQELYHKHCGNFLKGVWELLKCDINQIFLTTEIKDTIQWYDKVARVFHSISIGIV